MKSCLDLLQAMLDKSTDCTCSPEQEADAALGCCKSCEIFSDAIAICDQIRETAIAHGIESAKPRYVGPTRRQKQVIARMREGWRLRQGVFEPFEIRSPASGRYAITECQGLQRKTVQGIIDAGFIEPDGDGGYRLRKNA